MPSSSLSRAIRFRAACCHLAGLAWLPLLPLVAGCLNLLLTVVFNDSSEFLSLITLLSFTLLLVYSGIPATFWVWQRQRNIHSFIDERGREALNFQLSVSCFLTIVFILTTLLVIPACSDVAHHYTSPKTQFVFSWVVGWIVLESAWALPLLAPFILFAAVQACRGRSHSHALIRWFVR